MPCRLDSLSSCVDIATADAKKRSRDLGDDKAYLSPEVLSRLSRSERKRHRVEKRRREVNKGFEDMMNILVEIYIDPEVRIEAEERARRGQRKGSIGAEEGQLAYSI